MYGHIDKEGHLVPGGPPQKRAIITGITGQTGAWLAKSLLEDGYVVYGLTRRCSTDNLYRLRYLNILDHNNLFLVEGDLNDPDSVRELFRKCPDEFYHLGAQSHVQTSFNQPTYTFQTNTIGTLNVLEALRHVYPTCRLYFAGTSEEFGSSVDDDGYQRETTPLHPRSPYAVSKQAAHALVVNYREAYGLHLSVGLSFNHESCLRGELFVTRKITKYVAALSTKLHMSGDITDFPKLQLGNLKSSRDWSDARDIVDGIKLIVAQNVPDDYVLASGYTYSVERFLKEAFKWIPQRYKDELPIRWEDYVEINPDFIRPAEVEYLRGDATKASKKLGWKPKYDFKDMVHDMVLHDMVECSAAASRNRYCECDFNTVDLVMNKKELVHGEISW